MDGTILDTIDDLRNALNHSMERFGHKSDFTAEEAKLFFDSGARTALLRALLREAGVPLEQLDLAGTPDAPLPQVSDAVLTEILDYYKPYYAAHCTIRTGPFPGIPELLADLRRAGIRTAVVSNKPDPAVQKLCIAYFPDCFDYISGEKPGVRRKPAPDMIEQALTALGVSREEAVYIGDTKIDLLTSKGAGLDCICVDWGFRPRSFLLQEGARAVASTPRQLQKLLLG